MRQYAPIVALLVLLSGAGPLAAQSLRGSPASLTRQNRAARQHDFSYLKTSSDVKRFVRLGLLVRVQPTADLAVDEVSFPYARPAVKQFLEALARRYRAACGRKLVVTSLTRPETRQPRNASDRSVHPTGMAMDLRRTNHMPCRGWLEATLLALEDQGVLEATRERYPPHYHVALFPQPYKRYVRAGGVLDPSGGEGRIYVVKRGDSLFSIARRHNTTVDRLKRFNRLRSSRIYAGQVLRIPEEGK